MNLTANAQGALDQVVERFKAGDLSAVVEPSRLYQLEGNQFRSLLGNSAEQPQLGRRAARHSRPTTPW